ncbi:MAG: GNAT family N-acetyltransferase [Acidimicrobiia bacterium]
MPDADAPTTLRLHGAGDAPSIAAATVRAASVDIGLGAESADRLAEATANVVREVIARAFDDASDATVELSVDDRHDAVVVRVDDLGLPFALTGDAVLAAVLSSGAVDELHQEQRGADGNRTELVVHHEPHPTADIRATAALSDHHDAHAAPEAHVDTEVETRAMTADDADGLARLTWRTYGYTYQHHEFYRPDVLAELIESGAMRSWIGIAPDGEIIGHTAFMCPHDTPLVVEGGRAMVDPRYRGHKVMQHLFVHWKEWVDEHGVYGLYGDAVTAHTRSQALGGGPDRPVIGLLLGYLPPTVAFRRIVTEATPRRQAVVMGYTPFRPMPEATVHLPETDRAWIERIYDTNGIPRTYGPSDGALADATSTIDAQVYGDIGLALLDITCAGHDLHAVALDRLRSLRTAGIDVVYADLPLDDPTTSAAADELSRLGFSFGGVIPLWRGAGGDVVRYQHVGDIDVQADEIEILSDMGKELLTYVLKRRDAVC